MKMFRKKKKDEKISKKKLLKAVEKEAKVLGDVSRDFSHADKVLRVEDLQRIVREL